MYLFFGNLNPKLNTFFTIPDNVNTPIGIRLNVSMVVNFFYTTELILLECIYYIKSIMHIENKMLSPHSSQSQTKYNSLIKFIIIYWYVQKL